MNDVMPRSKYQISFFVILDESFELRFGLGRSKLIFGPGWGRSSYEMRGAHVHWLSQWFESWRWTNCHHRKIVSLSPRVENLNWKELIKVPYLYPESRRCFVFFGFLCKWTFYASECFGRMLQLHILWDDWPILLGTRISCVYYQ